MFTQGLHQTSSCCHQYVTVTAVLSTLLIVEEANPVETLQNQFSGYGSTPQTVARTLDRLKLKESLEHWSSEIINSVVNAFIDEKFPTVFALNKIDHPDADKNISKIAKMQDPQSIVLCSAISEIFLRKLAKQGFVRYVEGSEFVDTRDNLLEMGEADGGGLKELDEKLKSRIENLKDMVLYRFGSTGVVQVLSRTYPSEVKLSPLNLSFSLGIRIRSVNSLNLPWLAIIPQTSTTDFETMIQEPRSFWVWYLSSPSRIYMVLVRGLGAMPYSEIASR